MAGATVEEIAFEDVNMWQAPVSQKPPLWEPRMWQSQVWEARPDGESTACFGNTRTLVDNQAQEGFGDLFLHLQLI